MAILPPIPPHEDERLDALRRLNLLDSEADPAYQALAELAASLIGTPIAAISLLDADRQWTKAGVGLVHGDQDPRDISFCAHAINHDEPWVIDDAAAHPDFADNPLVTGGRVGFYAGAPVRTADGHAVGTLCVIDPAPRKLDDAGRQRLKTLAAAVSAHVEVRRQALAAAERHAELRAVIEHSPDAFLRCDAESTILEINARCEALLGWDRDALIGLRAVDVILPPAEREQHLANFATAQRTHGIEGIPHEPAEYIIRHRDGSTFPVELSIGATETGHDGIRFNIFLRDITERVERRTERIQEIEGLAALAEVTSRLARGLDDAELRDQLCHAAVKVASGTEAMLLVADADGVLTVTGTTDPAWNGLRIEHGTKSLAREAHRAREPRFAADTAAEGWTVAAEHGMRSAIMQPILADGRCLGVLAVLWRDAIPVLAERTSRLLNLLAHEASTAFARTALFARLAKQSRTDALTGVLNRRALDDELHLALLNARRDGADVSVAMLDLDHFKNYNDSHGHSAGDTLLKGACAAWSETLRSGDVLARFGGEEFVVVLPGCAAADAGTLIDRLRGVTPCGQTCSAGVATWNGSEAIGELLERADQALYRAKGAGRNRVCLA